jgi:peptide/nickel transport system substrate-binding protein
VERTPLPRIFGFFFNQSQQPIFVDSAVRNALDVAVNKEAIVEKVLSGYGKVIDSPLPFLESASSSHEIASSSERILAARAILEKAGWTKNAANVYEKTDKKKKTVTLLSFSIALPDVAELRSAAELAKSDWQQLGADVTIKVFEQSSFASNVLSPRKYDILLYGQVIGRDPDPYPYWHSSQRNSPGINIALYANKNVDKYLESARKESDIVERQVQLTKFVDEVHKDTPAIFLYSPDFLYATAAQVHGVQIGIITTESERFLGVENWYIDSERVWKWIADRKKRT